MSVFDRLRGSLGRARSALAFDAGKSQRRLRGVPTTSAAINSQIRTYGRTVLARSRYLAANNPYAANARETFVSALVGSGIKPSALTDDAGLKQALQRAWLGWTDEADADGITDLYGIQAAIAGEMFEAGECFVRFRPRRPEDGLSVPLQLQLLPAEMLPLDHNRDIGGGRRIECGIEFDAIGRRTAYHFLRQHPGSEFRYGSFASETVAVPADEVLHLYRPIRRGQLRGLPHTLSAIAKLAMLDQYDDAELERKKIAALFAGFVTRQALDEDNHPLNQGAVNSERNAAGAAPTNSLGLEPGAMIDLELGEDVKFSEPADVGGNYEAFQYRTLLSIAAGFGVPYAAMTGDLRQTSYGSIRAGLVEFRRRIEAMQHHVMVFQFCRPVWQRWLDEAVLAQAVPVGFADFVSRRADLRRVKWIPPRWEWIDPQKDRQAEKLAVRAGFKSLADVIEAEGYDPEETIARIAQMRDLAKRYDLILDSDAANTSGAGVTQARPPGSEFPDDDPEDPPSPNKET